jgi:acetolactate synthase-1/2/3 large subunit
LGKAASLVFGQAARLIGGMNGAETLVHTLADSGIEICFGNPGTSEMHFVAALDREPRMRGVLCLFEGVVAGAADGYARMAGKPAATLLHLGPGFANAIAFLHNARKAGQGIVNIVGDHATSHSQYAQAPLTSDIMAICGGVSDWLHQSKSASEVAADGARAVQAARRGQIATLVLPANCAADSAGRSGVSDSREDCRRAEVRQAQPAVAARLLPGTRRAAGGGAHRGRYRRAHRP